MAFALTLVYLIFTLLSPAALPTWLAATHVSIVSGVLLILCLLPLLPESKIFKTPDAGMVFGFLFVCVCSSLFNKGRAPALETLTGLFPIIGTFFFVQITCRTLTKLRVTAVTLGLVALFIFINGYLAYLAGDLQNKYIIGQGVGEGVLIMRIRGLGVLSDPNDLAQYFIAVVPLLFLRWKPNRSVVNFFFSILPSIILLIGVYYTHSRGAIFGLAVMLLFAFKDKLGTIGAGITVAVIMLGLVGAGMSGGRGVSDDDGGRIAAWMTALTVGAHHPVVGVGVGNFPEFNETGLTAHNSFVLCLAETGLIGYFAWMSIIVTEWMRLTRIRFAGLPTPVATDDDLPRGLPAHLALPRRVSAQGPPNAFTPWKTPVAAMAGQPRFGAVAAMSDVARAEPAAPVRGLDETGKPIEMDDQAASFAAHCIRTSLIGLLATAFFISRTYSVTLYIVAGMAAALWSFRSDAYPGDIIAPKLLFKRSVWVTILSIIFLIVSIRLIGIH